MDCNEEKNKNSIDLNENLDEFDKFWDSDNTSMVPVEFDASVLDEIPEIFSTNKSMKIKKKPLTKEARETRRRRRNMASAKRTRERQKIYNDEAFKFMKDLESKVKYYEFLLKNVDETNAPVVTETSILKEAISFYDWKNIEIEEYAKQERLSSENKDEPATKRLKTDED